MKIKSISISETPYYDKGKWGEYKAACTVGTEYAHDASINISLTAEQMALIVPIAAFKCDGA